LYSTEATSFFVWIFSFTQNILHSLSLSFLNNFLDKKQKVSKEILTKKIIFNNLFKVSEFFEGEDKSEKKDYY
ncbi:hypothetical protein, partial [Enterococcus faecium]|uniref:hypothetical protein n=1 Tax=Enterococcus faecium TaxID=1352 RepID=UPI000FA786A5